MKDGSDAIADWPLLNALINAVGGATWVSLHHGGGVGIGYSIHAGQVIVADGTPEADRRLERVLTTDPGMGVVRHADAGYPEAIEFAQAARRRHPDASQGIETRFAPQNGFPEARNLHLAPPERQPPGGARCSSRRRSTSCDSPTRIRIGSTPSLPVC